jgi:hypothetical protein
LEVAPAQVAAEVVPMVVKNAPAYSIREGLAILCWYTPGLGRQGQ